MKQPTEIEIEGKKHYVKVGGLFKTPRFVYPLRINGVFNWRNFLIGNFSNLGLLLIYMGIAAAIYFGMHQIVEQCNYVLQNPCEVCYNISNIINLDDVKYVSSHPDF